MITSKIKNILKPFIKWGVSKIPLKNIIMICSHNDFDVNGGAFYDYLIKNKYNEKWKIVWVLRHPDKRPKNLPQNVDWVSIKGLSIKKIYYLCRSKIFTTDDAFIQAINPKQKVYYLTHGCGGFKSVKGKIVIPSFVNYILLQSERYVNIQAQQYSLDPKDKRIVFLGYPCHDLLCEGEGFELKKIRTADFSKVVLWMPTFRKHFSGVRNDIAEENPFDVPLIKNLKEFESFNDFLRDRNTLLVVKLHPFQDVSTLQISSLSNIEVLTGNDVKDRCIDNYRLMRSVDALISDYSGAAYEFLQCNKPIAYVTCDMNEYNIGFVVDDIRTLMGGPEIKTIDDMYSFIESVCKEQDDYAEKRQEIRDFIYEYHDANNCKRLVEFMGL